MKKVSLFSLVLLLCISFVTGVSAESQGNLSVKELAEVNKVLEELRVEVNEKLANGETEFIVKDTIFDTNGEVSLNIKQLIGNKNKTRNNSEPIRSEDFSVTLEYDGIGFDFSHTLYGTWSYDSSTYTIISSSANSSLSGPFYKKSHDTWTVKGTDAVHNVYSNGYFDPLYNPVVQYVTDFHVRVNATGTWTIERAEIGT